MYLNVVFYTIYSREGKYIRRKLYSKRSVRWKSLINVLDANSIMLMSFYKINYTYFDEIFLR